MFLKGPVQIIVSALVLPFLEKPTTLSNRDGLFGMAPFPGERGVSTGGC